MLIPSNLYNEEQLQRLKANEIVFDFERDYTDDEILDIEDKIVDCMLSQGFGLDGEPTKDCAFWENILDVFQDYYIDLPKK